MSPFGSMALLSVRGDGKDATDDPESSFSDRHMRVRFHPARQVLHGPSSFTLIIEDPMGVPEGNRPVITYNGIDVTSSFLSQASEISSDPFRREVKWKTRHMRLPAAADHDIKVIYQRDKQTPAIVAKYLPPACSAFATTGMVAAIPDFQPPFDLVQQINQSSIDQNLNPFFVAALVAQESGFNPHAVSRSRAMGLTQVTSLGAEEIARRYNHWPRYPGVGQMPFPILKLAVIGGQIHRGNEWRLDPNLSIQGGVAYLSYLSDYWKRPDKRALVERRLGPSETLLSEVILASYNSGAARVGEALNRRGDKYLKDENLTEAKKYVHRVVSYCDHFENKGE